jgi:hypothetical protein
LGASLMIGATMYRGDHFGDVLWLMLLWLPVALAYGLIITAIFSRSGFANERKIPELSGVCIGSFPLVFGWPPYWMRLDVALCSILIQCGSLAVVTFVTHAMGLAFKKVRKKN